MNEKDFQLKMLFDACLTCLQDNGSLKVIFTYDHDIVQQVERCYKVGATRGEVDRQIQHALDAYHKEDE